MKRGRSFETIMRKSKMLKDSARIPKSSNQEKGVCHGATPDFLFAAFPLRSLSIDCLGEFPVNFLTEVHRFDEVRQLLAAITAQGLLHEPQSPRLSMRSRELAQRSPTAPPRGWPVLAVRPGHGNTLSVFRTGLLALPVCARCLSANPIGSIAVPRYDILNLPRRVLRTDRGLKRSV